MWQSGVSIASVALRWEHTRLNEVYSSAPMRHLYPWLCSIEAHHDLDAPAMWRCRPGITPSGLSKSCLRFGNVAWPLGADAPRYAPRGRRRICRAARA